MGGGVDKPIQPIPDAAQAGPMGKRRWAIAEGFIPPGSTGEGPEFESHETVCILNANDAPAAVRITLFFEDRDPVGPYGVEVPARRTVHVRFNSFENPEIPKGLGFASIIESDLPIVCQHTRLDSRQAELALLSTVAFSEG